VSMVATGTAQGPYPGAFREEVTVVLGHVIRSDDGRDVKSVSGAFSIDSPLGHVEGSLAFDPALTRAVGDPSRAGASGFCLTEPPFPGSTMPTPHFNAGGVMTSYEATITTPDGCTYFDHGGDAQPADDTVFAGGFDVRDAPYPLGRTVAQNFLSDGQRLEAADGCGTGGFADFAGFFPPVDNLPVLNTVNAGRGVPVKFSLGGDQGTAIFADGYPRSEQVDCSAIAHSEVDGVEETEAAGSSSLSYDGAADRYAYLWSTSEAWAGMCRQFVMQLLDGSVHRANFEFR
jgi:hypothetical protein